MVLKTKKSGGIFMSRGIFGNMFDFNGDGDLNWMEQATELSFLQLLMEEEEKDDDDDDE